MANDYGQLLICWAGVIDNGEGSTNTYPWDHGPFGSLYLEVYSDKCRIESGENRFNHVHLAGPHWTGSKGEWKDGDEKSYTYFPIYHWNRQDETVYVSIWESDPGPFRSHDHLFCAQINRKQTFSGTIFESTLLISENQRDALENTRRMNPGWISQKLGRKIEMGMPKMFIELVTKPHEKEIITPEHKSFKPDNFSQHIFWDGNQWMMMYYSPHGYSYPQVFIENTIRYKGVIYTKKENNWVYEPDFIK